MRVLGVIEFVALSRQEQREVEFVLGDRLGTESLRRCLVGGSLHLLALTECDDPSDQRNDEEESAPEQPPQPAVRASLALHGLLAGLPARTEEVAFEFVQLERVLGRPVQRRRESGPR